MSVHLVAEHLGIARDTVSRWSWIESRGPPAHRIGRPERFKLSDIDEWVGASGVAEHADTDATAAGRKR